MLCLNETSKKYAYDAMTPRHATPELYLPRSPHRSFAGWPMQECQLKTNTLSISRKENKKATVTG